MSDITGCTHTLARCQLCPKLTSAVSQRLAHRVPRPFVHVLEHTAVQHSKGERTMGSTKNTHTSRLPTPTPTETDLWIPSKHRRDQGTIQGCRGGREMSSPSHHTQRLWTRDHSAPQSASINNRVNWASGNVWKTLTNLSLNHLYFQILGKTASAPQVIKLLVCFNRSQKMCVYMHLCTNHTFRWFFLSLMLKLESWFLYVRWSSHRPGPHLHISPGKHHFLLRKQVWNGCLHLHKSTDYRRRRGK